MPLKLEEKFAVMDHDQKVDDIVTPPDLSSVFKRKLAKNTILNYRPLS